MKKKIALLLCSTGNEAFAVGNVIIGAKKYLFQNLKDEEYDIVFYTDKLEANDENALKKIFPRIIIRIYEPPFNINDNTADITYYSFFTFARFEIFDMLDDYKTILYMDTDMVIQKDISNIININDCFSISFYKNGTIPLHYKMREFTLNKMKEKYNMDMIRAMAGLFLINDNFPRYKELKEWCYKQIKIYECNDEDILNICLQEFNVKPNVLSEHYNCMPDSPIVNDAYIVHSIGPAKFWRGTYNKYWEENNKIWIEAGGNTTYNEIYKKRKIIDKIVWLIPNYNLRNKVRGFLLRKIGLSGR
ncbi:glycosyltransferase [Brachyspira pilosicoli]|uniref:Glycosyl transferase family 8 n=1 Tax=Brachyspira pilosicoli TaxID=52584 RepID=A0A5C8F372_BRAPL|nr:glycosyltransferase [Brachyspira pilosicoli]TXJ43949.1 glycosyl transferase family 8 [Brachyspira pilosicoli]